MVFIRHIPRFIFFCKCQNAKNGACIAYANAKKNSACGASASVPKKDSSQMRSRLLFHFQFFLHLKNLISVLCSLYKVEFLSSLLHESLCMSDALF